MKRGRKKARTRYHGQYLLGIVLIGFLALFAYGIYATDSGVNAKVNAVVVQFVGDNPGDRADREDGAGHEDRIGHEDGAGREDEAIREDRTGSEDGAGSEGTYSADTRQILEVHYLDVGQGDATLIRCGGQTMLIDAGEEDQGTAIQYYLRQQGIEKLDYLVLTHPDSDHIGSADVIITKFEIGSVILTDYEKDSASCRDLLMAMEYRNMTPHTAVVGDTFPLGSAECTILGPVKEYQDANNASIVLMVQNGGDRFLFTGDAQVQAEEDILGCGYDLQADVYKAGHHGSSTSSSESWLDAVSPRYAIVSCGKDNEYGHPHEEVLKRLADRNVEVYRTDTDGTIVMISDGSGITVQ